MKYMYLFLFSLLSLQNLAAKHAGTTFSVTISNSRDIPEVTPSIAAPTARFLAPSPSILYVNVNKATSGDGNSWEAAFHTLQEALDKADGINFTQIWVAGGTYKPTAMPTGAQKGPTDRNNVFFLKKDVKIYGGFAGTENKLEERDLTLTENASILSGDFNGDDVVKIDTITHNKENAHHVVMTYGDMGDALLDGFTITGGNASGSEETPLLLTNNNGSEYIPMIYGGGIYNYKSTSSFDHLIITGNNSSDGGGGIYNKNSTCLLKNSTLLLNSANNNGGGIFNDDYSSVTLTSVQIKGNRVSNGMGGGINSQNSKLTVINSLISGNYANAPGGGLSLENSRSTIINSTITSNLSENYAGAIYGNDSRKVEIVNSIIYGNNGKGNGIKGLHYEGSSDSLKIKNSLVQTGYYAPGTIGHVDPLFVKELPAGCSIDGDYRLLPCSPVLDKGDNSVVVTNHDLDGNPRRSTSGIIDMGAYERQGTRSLGHLFVKEGGTGDGSSWQNASGNLQEMIYQGCELISVWVAAGTYKPRTMPTGAQKGPTDRSNVFFLKKDVKIYGGFAGTETTLEERDLTLAENASILSGDFNGDDVVRIATTGTPIDTMITHNKENAHHVVMTYGDMGDALLDGFTITGGNASGSEETPLLLTNDNGSEYIPMIYGGGIYNYKSTSSFDHLVITGNNSSDGGGGVYNKNASCSLKNSTLLLNSSSNNGGGVFNDDSSSVTLTSVQIKGNQVSNGKGGGINSQKSKLTVINSLISGNYAGAPGGGLCLEGSRSTIINSTITSNLSQYGSGGAIYGDAPLKVEIINSIFYGNMPGIDNGEFDFSNSPDSLSMRNNLLGSTQYMAGNALISSDPLFVNSLEAGLSTGGDYRLSAGSQAINVGSNALYLAAGGNLTKDRDLGGLTRLVGENIDLGAYEYRFNTDAADLASLVLSKGTLNSVFDPKTLDYTATTVAYTDSSIRVTPTASFPGTVIQIKVNDGSYENILSGQESADLPLKTGINLISIQVTGDTYSGARMSAAMAEVNNTYTIEVTKEIDPLPVRLISFTGKRTEINEATLHWKTADEVNFKLFEIQRSIDAKLFETTGIVAGNLPSDTQVKSYYFTDANLKPGYKYYYRLKMVDTDGSTALSRLISINSPEDKATVIGEFYPNPVVTEKVAIDIVAAKKGMWKVSVVDLIGNEKQLTETELSLGQNKLLLDVSRAGKGISIVKFENNGQTFTRKLVVF